MSLRTLALASLLLAPAALAQPPTPSDAEYDAFAGDLLSVIKERGCGAERGTAGHSLAAVWLRASFHDIGTWFASNTSFGSDGSLLNELERAENKGLVRADMPDRHTAHGLGNISAADSIGLGAVVSIAACGGPQVNFFTGRSDLLGFDTGATNPAGLIPLPEQSNATIIARMQSMGLEDVDIVALSSGSHTLG
ncbi:heme peroxidase, partial [Blyttiomyces helicus]